MPSANCAVAINVLQLDVFGSAARETDFSESSDIDLLVEYEPSYAPPALGDFFTLRDALADMFGRKVDLTMPSAVHNPYLRAAIERSRQGCGQLLMFRNLRNTVLIDLLPKLVPSAFG